MDSMAMKSGSNEAIYFVTIVPVSPGKTEVKVEKSSSKVQTVSNCDQNFN